MLLSQLFDFWDEHFDSLPSKEREENQRTLQTLDNKSDPSKVLETLNITQEQIKSMKAAIDERQPKRPFDLAILNKVAQEYLNHCWKYKLRGASQMTTLAKTIDEFTVIASDTTRPTEKRVAAGLDVLLILSIHSKITIPLTSCLRQVQLFKMEKRFASIEESYQALKTEDERIPEEDVPAESLLSFCQALNNSFKPTEPAPKPGKKKGKKKLRDLEAHAQLQNNLRLASEEIQDLKATNDTQDFEELPRATPVLTYASVPIPQGIPDHVRQRFLDADFALRQFMDVFKEASRTRLNVCSLLSALKTANQEVWYVHSEAITPVEPVDRMPATLSLILRQQLPILTLSFTREHTKKVAHEMPHLREYEYNRIALNAKLLILSRQEVKIVEFYRGRPATDFPLAMKQALFVGSMPPEEFKEAWVGALRGSLF